MSGDLLLFGYPLQGWQLLLAGTVGPALAWLGGHHLALRNLRLAERSQDMTSISAVTAASTQLVQQFRAELDRVQVLLDRYRAEVEQLRTYRYTLEERIAALFEAALAARTMLHELQRRLGEPETVFPPLVPPGPLAGVAPKP